MHMSNCVSGGVSHPILPAHFNNPQLTPVKVPPRRTVLAKNLNFLRVHTAEILFETISSAF